MSAPNPNYVYGILNDIGAYLTVNDTTDELEVVTCKSANNSATHRQLFVFDADSSDSSIAKRQDFKHNEYRSGPP